MSQYNDICATYTLQNDESPHLRSVSQLLVFIRMAFIIGDIKKFLMKTTQTHVNTKVNIYCKVFVMAFWK